MVARRGEIKPQDTLVVACGDCPSDVGSIPTASTTSVYRNILCRSEPASPRGGFWRVIASFSALSASQTFGRLTPFAPPLAAPNRPPGIFFSLW